MSGHVFLGLGFFLYVFLCLSVPRHLIGYSRRPSGEIYSSTRRVFEAESYGIQQELQRGFVGFGKLLSHAERAWIRFIYFTALTGAEAFEFNSHLSGNVRSSAEWVFGCGNCGI